MTAIVPVSCPMDCFDLCRFLVTVDGNRITGLQGDPHHPLTCGVICKKGRGLLDRHHHPDRLTYPLLRQGQSFQRISYDRALDLLADQLCRIKKDHGPTAVLNYSSDGYGGMKNRIQSIFLNTWGGDSRFSGSLCWSAGMAATTYDFGQARGHLPQDVLNSDLVMVWGRNPRVTNIHFYHLLQKARKNGTQIVVIDPVHTATAQKADTYIRIKPAADGALAMAMAHVVIHELGLADMAFIRNRVQGFKRFSDQVAAFTPETAEEITGIPAEQIRTLAKKYAESRAAAIYLGYGMQRYSNGGNNVRAVNALAAICGHIGKPGGGVNYAAKSIAPFLSGPEKRSLEKAPARRSFPAPRLGSFLKSAQDPPIQLALFSSGNPMVQTPDTALALEGMSAVPFKVVFDQFMTDTAARADLVLPAATVFEQADLFVTSMYSHIAHFSRQAVEPPKSLMPEFDLYLKLADRMGLDLGFASSRDYLEQCAAPLLDHLNQGRAETLSLDDLAERYTRLPEDDLPWESGGFSTPSQKIEIFSTRAAEDGLSPMPEYLPPMAPPKGYPLRLLTCHGEGSMHSQGFLDHEGLPKIRLCRATADKLGIRDQMKVRVMGENGEVKALAFLDEAIQKDTAFMVQGSWHKSGAVNFLTRERVTDMGHQAAFYDAFCSITPL